MKGNWGFLFWEKVNFVVLMNFDKHREENTVSDDNLENH